MLEVAPIAVKTTYGAWQAGGAVATAIMAFGTIIFAIIKIAPRWRELGIGGEAALRQQQGTRIDMLERRIDAQEKRHLAYNEIVRQLHEAEIALMRHRLANEEMTNMAFLTLLKTLDVPERALSSIEASKATKASSIAREQEALTLLRAVATEKIAALMEQVK